MTYEQLLADPAVKGLSIGCCVDGSKWRDNNGHEEVAHAHTVSSDDRYPGYICIRTWAELFEADRRHVSATVLEELAHLRANAGHNESWRREMRLLAQSIPARYRKRTR